MTEETIKCPNCGTENSVDDAFCKECGTKLQEIIINDKISFPKKHKNPCSLIEVISFFVISLLLATVLSFLIYLKFDIILTELNESNNESVFQQIYNSIEVVGCSVSICIGVVISLSLISYIRINQKLNDIYKMLNKN